MPDVFVRVSSGITFVHVGVVVGKVVPPPWGAARVYKRTCGPGEGGASSQEKREEARRGAEETGERGEGGVRCRTRRAVNAPAQRGRPKVRHHLCSFPVTSPDTPDSPSKLGDARMSISTQSHGWVRKIHGLWGEQRPQSPSEARPAVRADVEAALGHIQLHPNTLAAALYPQCLDIPKVLTAFAHMWKTTDGQSTGTPTCSPRSPLYSSTLPAKQGKQVPAGGAPFSHTLL